MGGCGGSSKERAATPATSAVSRAIQLEIERWRGSFKRISILEIFSDERSAPTRHAIVRDSPRSMS